VCVFVQMYVALLSLSDE